MSVIRTEKTSHFVAIDNAVVEDSRLSFAARGLLALLLSKPPAWEVSINHLIKQSPAGKDHIYTLIRELEKVGYMEKGDERRETGKFGGYDWIVKENPNRRGLSDTVADHRGGFTVAVEPDPANPKQVITQGSKTDISRTLADNKSYPQEPKDKPGMIPKDWQPSERFYKDLELRLIAKPTQTQIDKFVNYHRGKGTAVFDPDALFTTWVLSDHTRQQDAAKRAVKKSGKPMPREGEALKRLADELGVKYNGYDSWDTLRAKVSKAQQQQGGE